VNALAQELLVVAKEYLGPAAPAFLSRELKALGVNANTVETAQMGPLADRARVIASRLMDADRAAEFADKIEKQLGKRPASRQGAGQVEAGRVRLPRARREAQRCRLPSRSRASAPPARRQRWRPCPPPRRRCGVRTRR